MGLCLVRRETRPVNTGRNSARPVEYRGSRRSTWVEPNDLKNIGTPVRLLGRRKVGHDGPQGRYPSTTSWTYTEGERRKILLRLTTLRSPRTKTDSKE